MLTYVYRDEILLTNIEDTDNSYTYINTELNNRFRLPIHLTNRKPHAYEHFNKLTLWNLTIYVMNKYIQRNNVQFPDEIQGNIVFISWGSCV
jgi:hypothetical protein